MPDLATSEIEDLAYESWMGSGSDVRNSIREMLDAVAPAIAARAQVDILRRFAEHDIHGVLPHGDISNDWYHLGIDGAQDEARLWIEYVLDEAPVPAKEIEGKA